jgi:hypothetical protein
MEITREDNMKARRFVFSLVVVVCFLISIPAFGHHGASQYDSDHEVTVEGVVKSFEWTSPHSWLYVSVTNDKGETAEWAGETGAPGTMARRGWNSHTFKPGDKVKMSGHAAKNGTKVMFITKVSTADGGVL